MVHFLKCLPIDISSQELFGVAQEGLGTVEIARLLSFGEEFTKKFREGPMRLARLNVPLVFPGVIRHKDH